MSYISFLFRELKLTFMDNIGKLIAYFFEILFLIILCCLLLVVLGNVAYSLSYFVSLY